MLEAEESYKLTYKGTKLAAVHHLGEDGGFGYVQLYVRYLGSLHPISDLADIAETREQARRMLLMTAAWLLPAIAGLVVLAIFFAGETITVTINGD